MLAVSVLRYRFFRVAPWLLGSVLLHLLLATWGVWSMIHVAPEPLPPEVETVSIGLITPVTSAKPRTPSRPVRQSRPQSELSSSPAPADPTLPGPTAEPMSESVPEAASETALTPAEEMTQSSLSPEILTDPVPVMQQTLPEPVAPGEFRITASPPSAYLYYEVSLQRGSERLSGSGNLQWERQQDQYRIEITARAIVQVSKQVSTGRWQLNNGLAPQVYSDQRGLRSENRVEFERQSQPPRLYFSGSNSRAVLEAGMQDYASLIMQLSSLLASNPSNFYVGSAVRFPVTDVRKTRDMIFRLHEPEMLETGLGRLQAWRFSYQIAPGANDRNIDIWFARDADWLPVRLRFADPGRGEVLEFTLRRREAL
jgi:hypothetical protein